MNAQQFLDSVAGLVQLPPGSISAETVLEQLEGWDSMAVLEFLNFMDERFQLTVEPESVRNCRTAADLLNLATSLDRTGG